MIAREVVNGDHRTVWLWCPGCEKQHSVGIASPLGDHRVWAFNHDYTAPTFTPSLLVTYGHYVTGTLAKDCAECSTNRKRCGRCHSFIVDGQWQFLNDCSHSLAGKTVPIPELPAPWNGEPDPEDAADGVLRSGN